MSKAKNMSIAGATRIFFNAAQCKKDKAWVVR
jgi:hypothetical protein